MSADLGQLMKQARAGGAGERREAIRALQGIEAPDALSILQAMGATDPDRELRFEAVRAARELRTRLSTSTMSLAAGAGAGPAKLAERLASAVASERAKAIFGCLRYESEQVLGMVRELLDREESGKVRSLAIAAVGVLGGAGDADRLARFERDPEPEVRAATEEALAKLRELAPARPPAAGPATAAARDSKAPSSPKSAPPAVPKAAPALSGAPEARSAAPIRGAVGGPGRTGGEDRSGHRIASSNPFSARGRDASGRPAGGPAPAGARTMSTGTFALGKRGGAPSAGGTEAAPLASEMNEDERKRLEKLLTSLASGFLPQVEKDRLADRGTRLYAEISQRLKLPMLSEDALRALFFLACGDPGEAAARFRVCPREVLLQPKLQPLVTLTMPREELDRLLEAKDEVPEELKGKDRYPPEVLQLMLGTIRRGKAMMGEVDVSERTKLRIRVDTLQHLLDTGDVEEGHREVLNVKREIIRLTNRLNDKR